jgi:hypothetical protein
MALEPLGRDLHRKVVLARVEVRLRGEGVLPARLAKRLTGPPPDGHDGRPVLVRDGLAAHREVADEHERPGRRIDALARHREGRPPGSDEVDLLVAISPLGVILDDVIARVGGIRVHPERLDPEAAPNGAPGERPRPGNRVQLGNVCSLERFLGHGSSIR